MPVQVRIKCYFCNNSKSIILLGRRNWDKENYAIAQLLSFECCRDLRVVLLAAGQWQLFVDCSAAFRRSRADHFLNGGSSPDICQPSCCLVIPLIDSVLRKMLFRPDFTYIGARASKQAGLPDLKPASVTI